MNGEFEFLGWLERACRVQKNSRLLAGPGDDCAVLKTSPGKILLATTDELAQGTHFREVLPAPQLLAAKLLRVNLSDLAAMGSVKPLAVVCGAGLPPKTPARWLKNFTLALLDECVKFSTVLAGGNLARSKTLHVYLTAFGEADPKNLVSRNGAEPGDVIFSLGPLGLAAAALELGKKAGRLSRFFWKPEPQLKAGDLIGRLKLASVLMDNSDGLYKSVMTLAKSSGCGAKLELSQDCLHPLLAEHCRKSKKDWRKYVLYGGEDYGLVAAVPPQKIKKFVLTFPAAARVGEMIKGKKVIVDGGAKGESYEHF